MFELLFEGTQQEVIDEVVNKSPVVLEAFGGGLRSNERAPLKSTSMFDMDVWTISLVVRLEELVQLVHLHR